jgi:GT2 family glycosyltransferase
MQEDFFSQKLIQGSSSDQYLMASIIISNFNGEKHLYECLSSLMKLDYPQYEVIVVDAASTDRSIDIIERDFPKVRLIKKGKIGIGEAINDGISLAKGEFIVFDLNNDDIVDKNWLINLVKVLDSSPDIGVVCGKRFKYGTNKILDSAGGGRISFMTGRTPVSGANELDSEKYSFKKEVEWAPVIVTRREILKKVGLVDPDYYIYYEDSDFSLRVRRFGYKIVFVPSAVYWHKGSSTVGQNSRTFYYYMYRNQIRFILKNYPMRFMILALFYCLIFENLYDLPILVPPILKIITKFTPFFKYYAWAKNDLMLIKSRKDAILWNIKNLKNTFVSRHQNLY